MYQDYKNEYCQKGSTTQGNLQIQGNPYQWHFPQNQNKIFFNFYRNTKDLQIATATLRKKNGAERIRIPDFRLYKNYRNEISMVLEKKKKKDIDQWNRIESLDINQARIHSGGDSLFNEWC